MRANVFIRQENEEKWKAINNKSDWINTLLANSGDTSEYGKPRNINGEKFVTVLSETIPPDSNFKKEEPKPVFVPKAPDPELGYDCCQKDRPCKHWVWDEATGDRYVNTLTGNYKEV